MTALATLAARVPAPDASIARWLLAVPQLATGPHAGAIAGLLADGHTASYVYPEIAGYYLRWLAYRALRCGEGHEVAPAARGVQRWLGHWTALAGPPTRVHLDGSTGDWRNDALFCFDLAMVLRGLGSATKAGIVEPDARLVATLAALVGRCIGRDGAFDAVVALRADAPLPDRWSTRRGAFLAKAASGVLRASADLEGIPASLVDAAERTFAHSIDALASAPHAEVHPLLYACEGILDLPRHPRLAAALPTVAAAFATVCAQMSGEGDLPETLGAEGPTRLDVIAQALRVGALLRAHGARPAPDPRLLHRLQATLEAHIEPDGGLRFARGSPPSQRNTWAAMFADQAHDFMLADPASPTWWRDDPLIV